MGQVGGTGQLPPVRQLFLQQLFTIVPPPSYVQTGQAI